MVQKYKIFLNEQLLSVESLSDADKRINSLLISTPDELISLVHELESTGGTGDILIETPVSPAALLLDTFKLVRAAGGLVFKEPDLLLFIFRHGIWDLPKGKLKKLEDLEVGALREVTEETGLFNIRITGKIGKSYHIHQGKNRYILKETTWYEMQFDGTEEPFPQEEEAITAVSWFASPEIPGILTSTYRSLRELTSDYLLNKTQNKL
jgi:ADP-ribose pyrophosphatase YjhB (NUDIX family)